MFFVIIAGLATWAGWGAWTWRLAADRKAFEVCARARIDTALITDIRTNVVFTQAPSPAALRHMARLPGPLRIYMEWPAVDNARAAEAFGSADLEKVVEILMGLETNTALLLKELSESRRTALTGLYLFGSRITDESLKELSRPNSGFKALSMLHLSGTDVKITEAGLKELARPDGGLNALTELYLAGSPVTDAGLRELTRPGCGLKALIRLDLDNTQITDAGLKELARPDCGLKSVAVLYLAETRITDAGLKELSRPGSGLAALTDLHLGRTQVTAAGVEALQTARPGLRVGR